VNRKHDAQTDMAAALIELGKITEIASLLSSERAKIAQALVYAKYIVTQRMGMSRQSKD
jgi:predicted DNA-binding protein (UPF0251 family)